MKIGVLALQGDFREHIRVLEDLGVEAAEVRLPHELDELKGLIIPGGESTAIGMLMQKYGMDRAIKEKFEKGMKIWGTCAGAILIAKEISGEKKDFSLGLMDISVRRNGYGRQLQSFEANLNVKCIGGFKGVFIRAPKIVKCGDNCDVLAEYQGSPVMVHEQNLLATTFHPELTKDAGIHQYFIDMVKDEISIEIS